MSLFLLSLPSRLFVPVVLMLGLGLSGCASSPRAPANDPLPAVRPAVEASVISMPLTLDLEQLRTEVLKQLPSPVLNGSQTQVLRVHFNPGNDGKALEPGSCSIAALDCLTRKAGNAMAVDYTMPVETVINHQVFVRDLAMSMVANQFTVTTQIEFSVNTRIKSSMAQFGVASCGVNEAMPRIEFTLSGYVGWGAMGDIVITAKPYKLKWLRPCRITALKLDVESLLNFPVLRDKLQEIINDAVFGGLRQVSMRTQLAKAWPALNEPRQIQPNVWLLPRPEKISFAEPSGNGRYVSTGVLIRARPEIVTGAKPTVEQTPVPVPERGINGDSVHLAISGNIALDDAEKMLNQRLAHKPITAGGRTVLIEAIRLYGSKDKAVLSLMLSQPVKSEIFLLGKPVFDEEKNEVSFENLSYSLGTRDFLVKSADWLLGNSFREALQQKARFRFDDDLASALKEFREYRQDIGQGFVLKGGITRVRPQALYFTQDHLFVYVIVDGRLAVDMKSEGK
jgi:hypothetical protein